MTQVFPNGKLNVLKKRFKLVNMWMLYMISHSEFGMGSK
jgi:hypothetical protein